MAASSLERAVHACRWGVISTGAIANDFTLALKATKGAVIHAVASRSQAAADEFATKHGFAHAYPTYAALIADADVEVVYVATPHNSHCEIILLCLNAGKHVVSEKPMAVNAQQAELCIQKAQEKGAPLHQQTAPSACRLPW